MPARTSALDFLANPHAIDMKLQLLAMIGLGAAVAAATISLAKAGEKDEVIIRELVAAQSLTFDPGGPTSITDSKVDGLLRELDPTAYKSAARALIQPNEQNYHHDTYSLVMKWVVTAPEESFDFLSTHCPALLLGNVAHGLFKEWAYREPKQALAAAKKLIPEGNRPELVSIVLQIMAIKSPREAMLEIDVTHSHYTTLISDILVYWTSVNTVDASHWALSQRHHHHLVWDVAYSWSSFDRKSALEWADTLAQEDRTMAQTATLTQQATTTRRQVGMPDKSAREFLDLFPNATLDQENYSNQAVMKLAQFIVGTWSARKDTQSDVMAWIMKLPDVPRRSELESEVLRKWAIENPDQMETFSDGLTPGTMKDTALKILVAQLATTNPTKGFETAKSIADENLRLSATSTLFYNWLRSDPDQANAALATLTPQKQDRILDAVNKIKERSRIRPY